MDGKPNTASGSLGVPGPPADAFRTPSAAGRRSFGDRIVGGLILVLPVLITLWIVHWLYSILETKVIDPLAMVVLWKLKWTTSSTELPYWFETYAAPLIAIVVALVLLYLLDYFADTRLRRTVGYILANVPVISLVYNPVQKMFQAMEKQPGQQGPQRLVLIKFPHEGIKLPAFVTASCRDLETQRNLLCVYVPTTPVPTSGFFLMVPEDDVTELNWNSEQTLQAIMSGGLTAPPEVSFFGSKPPGTLAATPPEGERRPSH